MPPRLTKLVVLDLDGPLLDGRDRHYQCYRDILADFNSEAIERDIYWDLKRNRTSLATQLEQSGVAHLCDQFLSEWLKRIELPEYLALDRIQPFAIEALEELRGQAISAVLMTMRNHSEHLYRQLDELGLTGFFDKIVAVKSERGVTSKLNAALELLSTFEPGDLLWVGDTEADVLPAQQLKIPVCAIDTGLRSHAYLASLQPDFIIHSMANLNDVIKTRSR